MTIQANLRATAMGRVVLLIAGVRFAVIALSLAAIAMARGTWIDATVGRDAAFERVYASWWFVTLMALICACLILSVAVRYPWKKKHVGFMIVHASLVSLIVIGFYTMFTKLEGRIILQENSSESRMQMDRRWIQVLGPSETIEAYGIVRSEGDVELRRRDRSIAATVTVTDIWANSEEVRRIANVGSTPVHAAEIAMDAAAESGRWMGEISDEDLAADIGGLDIRVVPAGETWTPPDAPASAVLAGPDGEVLPLPAEGERIGETGWTLTSVERFTHASVGDSGALVEVPTGRVNPATLVLLTHEDGSVERQLAFELARDEPFAAQLEGETASGLSLTYRGASFNQPTLAIMRDEEGRTSALYASPDGTTERLEHNGQWPWVVSFADDEIVVLRTFDRAARETVLEKRPSADQTTPVAVLDIDGDQIFCKWNTATSVVIDGEPLVLQYGPVTVNLPFELWLEDFRKMDYPGSEMAMAFESDVIVTPRVGSPPVAGEPFPFKIHMNHPYKQDGWKVYQSGFLGDDITVLQVTKDPGLVPMYIACTGLCIGIFVTFYSRSLSRGHPNIPVPFKGDTKASVPPTHRPPGQRERSPDATAGPGDADDTPPTDDSETTPPPRTPAESRELADQPA